MSELQLMRVSRVPQRWWQRMGDSLRSITLGPYSTKDKELARLFGGREASSGVSVNESTAMNYSAVWAAVNLISSHVGAVPLNLYKRIGEDGRGKDKFDSHPVHRLIHDRPNPHMGAAVFRRTLEAHALVWGGGFAEIERDQSNRPVALWPLVPYAVSPFFEGGQLKYRVHNPTKQDTILPAANTLHIRGPYSSDGITPVSVIAKARESLGLGIAAERFGSTFFGNGATFGGIIKYQAGTTTNEQTRKENREAIEQRHQGVDRSHRLLVLYEGAEYQQMGIPPNDAQFLQTREFQIEEVCRWFNLPPHKLKHLQRSTNNNIEHQGIEYVTDTLDPRWVVWEEELEMKLIPPLERSIQFIEHVREGLLRGDQSARGEFYGKLFSIGAITPNEIRERENLNPVKGGDTVYVPLNTLPLDRLDEYIDATLKSKTAPPTASAPKPEGDSDETKALREEVVLARLRAQSAEDAAGVEKSQRERSESEVAELERMLAVSSAQVQTLTADVASAAARVREMETQAGVWATRLAESDGAQDQAQAERDAALAEVATLTQQAAETEARIAALDVELSTCSLQLSGAIEQRDALTAKLAESDAVIVQRTAERDEQIAGRQIDADASTRAAADADERERTLTAEREAILVVAAQRERERDEARQAITNAETTIAALRSDVSTEQAAHEQTRGSSQAVAVERDALQAEAETLRTDLARARADLATESAEAAEAQRTQRAVLMTALRGLFVDATERVIQRELQRMANKRATATPEKLTAWVDEFYPLHRDFCRTAFKPIVAAWVACAGGEADVLLDQLVSQHVGVSVRALREAAETEDGDVLAANLARVVRQWETERPGDVADAVLREGMAEHG